VVAEDDLDLGAGQVQAQRPAGLGTHDCWKRQPRLRRVIRSNDR
jgi:hypothetical protein